MVTTYMPTSRPRSTHPNSPYPQASTTAAIKPARGTVTPRSTVVHETAVSHEEGGAAVRDGANSVGRDVVIASSSKIPSFHIRHDTGHGQLYGPVPFLAARRAPFGVDSPARVRIMQWDPPFRQFDAGLRPSGLLRRKVLLAPWLLGSLAPWLLGSLMLV